MKKMKKIFALLLVLAMVLGMTTTAFATTEYKVPESGDTAQITVNDVEAGATVKAYKIAQADYEADKSGLLGYSMLESIKNLLKGNYKDDIIFNPTSEFVDELTQIIVSNNIEGTTLTENDDGTYTTTKEAGLYLILVYNTDTNIYNPMLVSLGYRAVKDADNENAPDVSGTWNQLVDGAISANASFTGAEVYAKMTEVPFEKTASQTTVYDGEVVDFDIRTTVPSYNNSYKEVTFNVSDTLTGLTLVIPEKKEEAIKVQVGQNVISASMEDNVVVGSADGTIVYRITTLTAEKFVIEFDSDWVLDNDAANILIQYNATVSGEKVNADPFKNNATLTYTNAPNDTRSGKTDVEKVYTFKIDGNLTKVDDSENPIPLQGAEFTLYTDVECTNVYTNANYDDEETEEIEGAVVTTNEKGNILIDGLNVGTYYIKETKAPSGYSLNDTVYEIVIDAEFSETDSEQLVLWTITVKDVASVKDDKIVYGDVNNTSSYSVEKENAEDNTVTYTNKVTATVKNTNIVNIKLSALPSTGGIGTTIFTIGGCAIMIAAAFFFFVSRRKDA